MEYGTDLPVLSVIEPIDYVLHFNYITVISVVVYSILLDYKGFKICQ